MKRTTFRCDQCDKTEDRPKIILKGHWFSGGGGILLPRIVYHFCSKACLTKWLEKADLNEKMTL